MFGVEVYSAFNSFVPAPKFGHFWRFIFNFWQKIILKISKNGQIVDIRHKIVERTVHQRILARTGVSTVKRSGQVGKLSEVLKW